MPHRGHVALTILFHLARLSGVGSELEVAWPAHPRRPRGREPMKDCHSRLFP